MTFLNVEQYKRPVTIFTGDPKNNVPTGSCTMSDTYLSDTVIPVGTVVSKVGAVTRYLPRTVTTSAITGSSSTSFTASQVFPFVATDVLYILEPHAVFTFTSFADTETAIVTINGVVLPTLTGDGVVTTTGAATALASNINSNPRLAKVVYAIASGTSVYIFAYDGKTLYSVSESGTATAAFAGSATALAYNTTAIGTVSSVNKTTKTVTLTGTAGVTVPVGCKVGIYTNEVLGLDPFERDFTTATSQTLPLYNVSAGVYKERLPYFDGYVEEQLKLVNFVTKA